MEAKTLCVPPRFMDFDVLSKTVFIKMCLISYVLQQKGAPTTRSTNRKTLC